MISTHLPGNWKRKLTFGNVIYPSVRLSPLNKLYIDTLAAPGPDTSMRPSELQKEAAVSPGPGAQLHICTRRRHHPSKKSIIQRSLCIQLFECPFTPAEVLPSWSRYTWHNPVPNLSIG